MLTRQVRIQLIVFGVIAVVALTFASLAYVGLPQMFGLGRYTVTANFGDVSGLYPRAIVTYRGADVGQVTALDLKANGVAVKLAINNGEHVPSTGLKVELHSTSAIGEQYLDLVPSTDAGPYLRGGSVIPRSETVGLTQIGPVLDSVTQLISTIPKTKLSALLKELDTAFAGTGPDLQQLISSSSNLVNQAEAGLTPTVDLINDLAPFLKTQASLASDTSRYVDNLDTFTGQLVKSDAQVRTLLNEVPPAAAAISNLTSSLSTTLPVLLANLTSAGQVLYTYLPELKSLLVTYPALVAKLEPAFEQHGDIGLANLDLKVNINDPPTCIQGYVPVADRNNPSVTTPAATPTGLYCKISSTSATSVRGLRNDPCPNSSNRGATPADCGIDLPASPGDGEAYGPFPSLSPPSSGSSTVAVTTVPYEASTGRFVAPDGTFYQLGNVAKPKGDLTWQSLLTSPLAQ